MQKYARHGMFMVKSINKSTKFHSHRSQKCRTPPKYSNFNSSTHVKNEPPQHAHQAKKKEKRNPTKSVRLCVREHANENSCMHITA